MLETEIEPEPESEPGHSSFVLTPHEYLKSEILARGFHDQSDTSLLDTVDSFTYEVALLVAHVLDTRIRHGIEISDEELATFILSEWWAIVIDSWTTLN
jgi:alcohol dehydrogenase YqhD (iron-dependent ADH family)